MAFFAELVRDYWWALALIILVGSGLGISGGRRATQKVVFAIVIAAAVLFLLGIASIAIG